MNHGNSPAFQFSCDVSYSSFAVSRDCISAGNEVLKTLAKKVCVGTSEAASEQRC